MMSLENLWNKACEHFQNKNYLQVNDILHNFPPDPNVEFLKAQSYWMSGMYEDAIACFQNSVKLNPKEYRFHYALIKSLFSEYRIKEANIALDLASQYFPENVEIQIYKIFAQHRVINNDVMNQIFAINNVSDSNKRMIELRYLAELFEINDTIKLADEPVQNYKKQSFRKIYKANPDIIFYSMPKYLLKFALESVTLSGLYIETGVFFAQSLNIAAKSYPQIQFYGFDSFEGLPEKWKEGEDKGSYSTQQRLPVVEKNVQLIPGWFKDTISEFIHSREEIVAFLHIDCDIYSSTVDVLTALSDRIVSGTIILFDDFFGYPGFEDHEWKAFDEFLQVSGYNAEYLACCPLGREMLVKII